MRGMGVYGGIGGLALSALLAVIGPAAAQVQVETITAEDAGRPLTFQDWCGGIKGFDAQRCGEQRPEDQAGYKDAKRNLRALAIGPNSTLGCEANPNVNPNRNWVGGSGCNPIAEPPPDRQPFAGPR